MGNRRSAGHRVMLLAGIFATAVLLLGFGATAFAQDQQQEKPPEFKEEVTVTGTLIPRPTLEAMSPVTTMNVEDLAYQGTTRLEDMLTSLPQIFHGQNSTISNGASGTATIDLRYLGPVRTLVLIDGKRAPAGDPGAISPDLNFIPAALVKRVDVLTGGASATYGADAVAGVVNFILDRDFEGVKVGLMGGGYEHNNDAKFMQGINRDAGYTYPTGQAWDGGNFDAYTAFGGNFADGKGHATLYIDYRKTAADLKARRDYLTCSDTGYGAYCGGSSTIPNGRFRIYTPDYRHKLGDYTLNPETGVLEPYAGQYVYNYAPKNYMQRPDIRWAGGAFLNYEWNKHFQAYGDVMMMDDQSDAQIAESGSFGRFMTINCNNPMLSAAEVAAFCTSHGYGPNDMAPIAINRRGVEGGGRSDNLSHESFRLTLGLKGEIDKVWSYDVYGLDAQTRKPEVYKNDYSYPHIQDAIVVDGDPNDPSTWHCRSGNPACVPWDVFKLNGVTKAALAYASIPLVSIATVRTQVLSGKVTADLKDYGIAFPSASEGIGLALGTEYRTEYLDYSPDQNYIEGNGAGQGAKSPAVNGSYHVKEAFIELNVPIVQGAAGAKDLSLDLGYRYSDYTNNGGYGTWKVQGSWAPSADLKFRAGVNRATRAPNINELFSPSVVGISGGYSSDPCSNAPGGTPKWTLAQCVNTGVPADQYGHVDNNPAGQYNGRFAGTPTLKPEVADTKTLGVVFTPTGVSGFTAAFDYYQIKVNDVITVLPPGSILAVCANTGDPTLCAMIHRDSAGTLWGDNGYIDQPTGNYGHLEVEGVDANLTYTLPMGQSVLSFNMMGSYLMHSKNTNIFVNYDCAGYFGETCGDPSPKWRHLFRATLDMGTASLSLAWRYVGVVKNDEFNPSPDLNSPGDFADIKSVGSDRMTAYNFIDLAASLKVSKVTQFTVGVNNIADKTPPYAFGSSVADYGPGFHGTYDPYGRYIHGSVNFTF